jgi:hypothetical protein
MDGRGDNLGRWKGNILGLDIAQIKFPRLTLAQVLQKMALHDGTIVQGIQKRTQLFIQFVYSNCHFSWSAGITWEILPLANCHFLQ